MSGSKATEEEVITPVGCQGKACMVKPKLVKFQSLWPRSSRQRKMAETLDQKIGGYEISTPLSNSSGRPSLRGNRDERKTWSTLDLLLLKMRDHLNRVTPA